MTIKMRSLNGKRAVTPVLSSLLLTVVAVAAMALATSATYVITNNLRETMGERVIAEDLWFDSSTGYVEVYLRNIGKVPIQVNAVYVNHTSKFFTSPFRLGLGKHRWLNISSSWTSGSLYYVDIVTSRGTHVAGYYKAP